MEIRLEGIGKRFSTDWIFRGVSCRFEEHSVSAILGRNGSGKSTLLQVLAGSLHPTEGTVTYLLDGKAVEHDKIYRHLAMVAPYIDLIDEFTLAETVKFHFSFKNFLPGHNIGTLTDLLDFPAMKNKPVRKYSSGMKQRLKLALAILSDVPLLLLDEPTMNLDHAGTEWYRSLVTGFAGDRTIVICSNLYQSEADFAGNTLQIEDFKG